MEEMSRRDLLNKSLAGLLGVLGLDKLSKADELVDLSDYKVAFTSNRDHLYARDCWNVYTINADGSKEERITSGDFYDRRTSWSPNKRKIAFESNRDGDWNIYLMNHDGSRQERLTGKGINIFPFFSGDGEKIFFYSKKNSQFPWRINFMNIDKTNRKEIIDKNWDKICEESKLDKDYLIRLQTKMISIELGLNKSGDLIQSVNSGDYAIRMLIDYNSGDIMESIDYSKLKLNELKIPFISKNIPWEKIVYHSDESGSDDIYIIDTNGNNKKRLILHPAGDTNPCLSCDGKVLVFDSNRGPAWKVFVKPINGLEKKLTSGRHFDRFPSVSNPFKDLK